MATLMKFIWPGIVASQCLYVLARLGIADLVAASPRTLEELAAASGADATALRRLLRAAISIGVFGEDAEGQFHNTPVSEVLRSDHPESVVLGDDSAFARLLAASGRVIRDRKER